MAHVILVSAFGPNPSFFLFWGTFIQLGGLLGWGLGLGPGLDNNVFKGLSFISRELNSQNNKELFGFDLNLYCLRAQFITILYSNALTN